uniref:Nucleotide sugar dehydrogenase n=1 Tax=Litorilinea aerophila TaxID=1204385 RepID=A0A540V961_9CHLR
MGLGYVGLPLAVVFAEAGYRVIGIDVDPRKVDAINRGESYVEDVPSERLARVLEATVARQQTASDGRLWTHKQPSASDDGRSSVSGHRLSSIVHGRLSATTDFSVLAECDAVSICVPTPLSKTGDPDISYIVAASKAIAEHLHPGMVVVLESTTYPGTTREVVLPQLEAGYARRYGGDGPRRPANDEHPWTNDQRPSFVGEAFYLAFSPERVDPGRTDWTTQNTPKVIGGVTPACLEVAMAFYGQAIETLVPVSSPDAAEMVKLFENTFRMVNIGLANELLMMCDKLGLSLVYSTAREYRDC